MKHKELVEIATAELTRRLAQGDTDHRALVRAADLLDRIVPHVKNIALSARDITELNALCLYIDAERVAGRIPPVRPNGKPKRSK